MENKHRQAEDAACQDHPKFFHPPLRYEDNGGANTKRKGNEHAFRPDKHRDPHQECSAEKFQRSGMIPEVAHQEPERQVIRNRAKAIPENRKPCKKTGDPNRKTARSM